MVSSLVQPAEGPRDFCTIITQAPGALGEENPLSQLVPALLASCPPLCEVKSEA